MFLKIFGKIWANFQSTGKLLVNNRKKCKIEICEPGLRFALLNLEDSWITQECFQQKCSMSECEFNGYNI